MTRLWPTGDPVQVLLTADGTPQAFYWRGGWRQVTAVANRWRVRVSWWAEEAWREYVKVVTADGLLCTLCCDLRTGVWTCARLYD